MADYIVKDTELTGVANSIRTAGGTSSLLTFPNGFISAINNISGGGGSSDFSTAEVTVINNSVHTEFLKGSFLENGNISPSASFFQNTTSQRNLVIPTNGMSEVWYDGARTLAVTGNATEEDNESIYITGDCTITIS